MRRRMLIKNKPKSAPALRSAALRERILPLLFFLWLRTSQQQGENHHWEQLFMTQSLCPKDTMSAFA